MIYLQWLLIAVYVLGILGFAAELWLNDIVNENQNTWHWPLHRHIVHNIWLLILFITAGCGLALVYAMWVCVRWYGFNEFEDEFRLM